MPTLNINIPDADETTKGIAEVATQVETDAGTDDTRIVTPLKLESSAIRAEVTANNAKVTNATHTGEVTGSTALTVAATAISNKTLKATPAGTEEVLINDAGTLKKTTAQAIADLGGGGANYVAISYMHTNGTNLSDVADYFIMNTNTLLGNTNNSTARTPIKGGTVREVHLNTYVGGTFGSAEDATVTLETNDGAESNVISTTVKFDARNNYYSFTGLSWAISDGLSWVKLDTPTYVTNPTAAKIVITVYIEL